MQYTNSNEYYKAEEQKDIGSIDITFYEDNNKDLTNYQALYIAYEFSDNSIYIPTSIYNKYIASKNNIRPREIILEGIKYIRVTRDDINFISKVSSMPNLVPNYKKVNYIDDFTSKKDKLENDKNDYKTDNKNISVKDHLTNIDNESNEKSQFIELSRTLKAAQENYNRLSKDYEKALSFIMQQNNINKEEAINIINNNDYYMENTDKYTK